MSKKAQQRRQAILEFAQQTGHMPIEKLCQEFEVSEPTIRRDLSLLAESGLLMRTYGGAMTPPRIHEEETELSERQKLHRPQKEAIALAAQQFVTDGDTLLLDGGTTLARFAKELAAHRSLSIHTINLLALTTLARLPTAKIFLLGGSIRQASLSTLGEPALAALKHITVDRVFLSADGVTADDGLCEASYEQALLKEAMVERAAQIIVLADSSKIGRAPQRYWTPLSRPWTLVTDSGVSEAQLRPFRERKTITICIAPPPPPTRPPKADEGSAA